MNAEFFAAIADIEKEKGIPQGYMLEKIDQALAAAIRKDAGRDAAGAEVCVFVDMDESVKKIDLYIQKTVTEEITSANTEITLDEARKYARNPAVGDVVNIPVNTKKFGRIAAQAAKQVIIQGIREAERSMVYEQLNSKEHEILTGTVTHVDETRGTVSVKINSNAEYAEAVMNASERIPGEDLQEGDRIKVYVVEVRKTGNGPQVLVSRTHPGLVKRLFELEVPEIFDGTVEIKNIAREPGSRTKIAVTSNQPEVEPVGACVGPKGGRVNAIVSELRGEKMDIIRYSDDPAQYVTAALAPSGVTSVDMPADGGKLCHVTVPDDQLSLAIGREGQNVRLAAKLTGYKIDIRSESEQKARKAEAEELLPE